MRSSWLNNAVVAGLFAAAAGQAYGQSLQPGDQAPSFILNVGDNTIESVTWPYQQKIVLLHFWNAETPALAVYHRKLNRLHKKYRYASYRNADGFTVMSIAAQADRNGWKEIIARDSLADFVNGIAPGGISDPLCVKFGLDTLPATLLVDEEGKILARDATFTGLESLLDDRRNFQAIRKNIVGRLALSTSRNEVLRFGKVFLFNIYGDSLGERLTDEKGFFRFEDMKLSQDLFLKVDNKTDINTTDPIALYTVADDYLMDGRTREEGFVFALPTRVSSRLAEPDSGSATGDMFGEINVIKSLAFSEDGASLTTKDQQELKTIVARLQKNAAFKIDVVIHTDSRLTADSAMTVSKAQGAAITRHFAKNGIAANRIKCFPKGNTEPRKICEGSADCREEEYRLNRRVEFIVYRD